MPNPAEALDSTATSGSHGSPRALVVMGVAGSGKSTIARLAADRLGWPFLDADDLHAAASRDQMYRGVPLTDEQRGPWLEAIRTRMQETLREGRSVVVACSALRRAYRETLASLNRPVQFVWLDVPEAELRRRLGAREGHFAGIDLLASQLLVLEPPTAGEALRVPAIGPIADVVDQVVVAMR